MRVLMFVARWPEKSAKFLLGLLKNAGANADVSPNSLVQGLMCRRKD
jgi:ribosomal protein L22